MLLLKQQGPIWLPLLALLGAVSEAGACASCGCGDPTLTAMGMEKPFRHRIRLALESRAGIHEVPQDRERTFISRTSVSASYSPTTWLSLAGQIPFSAAWTQHPTRDLRSVYGMGDLDVLVRALPIRERAFAPRHLAGALVGLKLPTGPRRVDSTGYPAPDDMQPGSGSWDGILGLSYSYFGDALTFFAAASLRLTGRGYRDVQRGSSLGGSFLFQVPLGRRLALQGGIELSHTQPTRLASDAIAPNRGGFLASLTYGVLAALGRDFLLRVGVQTPLIQDWRGSQWESPTVVVSLAVDI